MNFQQFILTMDRTRLILLILSPILLFSYLTIFIDKNVCFFAIFLSQQLFLIIWVFFTGDFLTKNVNILGINSNFKKYYTIFLIIELLFIIIFGYLFGTTIAKNIVNSSFFSGIAFTFIMALHVIFLIKIYYIISKAYAYLRFKKEVRFEDFFGILIALIYLPVGIWIIQPRITKLYNKVNGQSSENNK